MKGYRLKLIRHGRTYANTNGSYIGLTDFALNAKGRDELYQKLEKYDYDTVQKVYSSPLLRCTQTAEILYPSAYMQTVDELREMNFGVFEGKTITELKDEPAYIEWIKGGPDIAPLHGESMRNMVERSFRAYQLIIDDMMKENLTNCAVITHAGIISNSLACFGVPKYKPMELASDFGEGFEVMITASMWQRSNAFEILGKFPYERLNNEEEN